jgi:hypothetical protein
MEQPRERKDKVVTKKWQQYGAALVMALALLTLACASTGKTDGKVRRNLNALHNEEMVEAGVSTLYEAIMRLRPNWLNVRAGSRSMGLASGVVVFQGQSLLGDTEILKQFGIDTVVELRYLDGTTASSTLPGLGSRHVAGAIILVLSPAGR